MGPKKQPAETTGTASKTTPAVKKSAKGKGDEKKSSGFNSKVPSRQKNQSPLLISDRLNTSSDQSKKKSFANPI